MLKLIINTNQIHKQLLIKLSYKLALLPFFSFPFAFHIPILSVQFNSNFQLIIFLPLYLKANFIYILQAQLNL